MKLKDLMKELSIEIKLKSENAHLTIKGITDNSATVSSGYLFIAIPGFNSDGHDYIKDAMNKGASVIVGEKAIPFLSVPYIQVENSRKSLGKIAKAFYGNVSEQKLVIGITGTNGKTTTSHIIKQILDYNGKSCAIFGTIQNVVNGKVLKSSNTTPSALDLHKLIAESNDEIVIIEVSSHGLSQFRIEGISFDYCLFTNLAPEHLDYHGTMGNYFHMKMLLFDHLKEHGQAIVNDDNYWGNSLVENLKNKGKNVLSIGNSPDCICQIRDLNSENSTATLEEKNSEGTNLISSPIAGEHNLYNTLMAYVTCKNIGIHHHQIMEALANFKGIEGRFETIHLENGATVVIDYAHTQDAILHCLITAKKKGAKQITHIFGFREGRYVNKRKEMISVTSKMSDRYILTFDDLNAAEPMEMIKTLDDLQNQYGDAEKGMIIPDRTEAIEWAINHSKKDDWIIITGKGHENYQSDFKLQTRSDRETVQYLQSHMKTRQRHHAISL